MFIQLTEPVAPRYIHIVSLTNTVHVLVPKESPEFNDFFNGGAVHELVEYKRALDFDIVLLKESIRRRATLLTSQPSDPFPFDERDIRRTTKKAQLTLIETLLLKERNLLAAKNVRLAQIETYIQEIRNMKASYSDDGLISALREIHPFAPVRYVSNQHATCVTFAAFIPPLAAPTPENPDYFQSVREDFACSPNPIPQGNEHIYLDNGIDVDVEQLLEFSDELLDRLLQSPENKEACRAHPAFNLRRFLGVVAKATPDKTDPTLIKTEAEALLLAATPEERQALLRASGVFTDYSGRTFNCTAFEYAYWAKDIHMCRMLMSHMDDEPKAELLARIKVIEGLDTTPGQLEGLSYQQAGIEHRSPHFNLEPLKTALQVYVDGYDAWEAASDWAAMKTAWLAVGIAQRAAGSCR